MTGHYLYIRLTKPRSGGSNPFQIVQSFTRPHSIYLNIERWTLYCCRQYCVERETELGNRNVNGQSNLTTAMRRGDAIRRRNGEAVNKRHRQGKRTKCSSTVARQKGDERVKRQEKQGPAKTDGGMGRESRGWGGKGSMMLKQMKGERIMSSTKDDQAYPSQKHENANQL